MTLVDEEKTAAPGNDATPCLAGGCRGLSGIVSGGGGIRTHGRLAPTPVFETGPFNHSGTPPVAVLKSEQFSGSSPIMEEQSEDFAALALEDAGCNGDAVVHPAVVHQAIKAPAGSRLGVGRAVNQPRYPA